MKPEDRHVATETFLEKVSRMLELIGRTEMAFPVGSRLGGTNGKFVLPLPNGDAVKFVLADGRLRCRYKPRKGRVQDS